MSEELRNCPFCGKEARYIGTPTQGYHVQCSACLTQSGWGDYGFQVAKKWNTRDPDTAQAELLREAVEALEDLIVVAANEAADYRSCADLPDGSIPDESDRAFIENIEGIVSRACATLAKIKGDSK